MDGRTKSEGKVNIIPDYIRKASDLFEEKRQELLKEHKGKFVVIHDQKIIGVFETISEAYHNGIEIAQSEEIFIKRILEADEIVYMRSPRFYKF